MVVDLGKSAHSHIVKVDEQPTKRSKTIDDKSAVAMLKKGNWQERESVTDECHDRPGKPGKRSDKKLGRKVIGKKEHMLPTNVTIERGNL